MPNHYTTICICSQGYDFDVDDFNSRHAASNLCAIVKPMPEPVESIPAISYPDGTTERERRGEATDWYTWAHEHWGTKWGTYDVRAFALGGDGNPIAIKFQSAWSAPTILEDIANWLMRTYNFDNVAFIGFNPYDDATALLGHFSHVDE